MLWLGLFAMFAATIGVIIGIVAFGGGGTERGLVVRNEAGQDVTVRFDDGDILHLQPREERTIGAKRGQYPQTVHVTTASGVLLWESKLTFSDLSANSFRLVIGPNGLIPTPPQSSSLADPRNWHATPPSVPLVRALS